MSAYPLHHDMDSADSESLGDAQSLEDEPGNAALESTVKAMSTKISELKKQSESRIDGLESQVKGLQKQLTDSKSKLQTDSAKIKEAKSEVLAQKGHAAVTGSAEDVAAMNTAVTQAKQQQAEVTKSREVAASTISQAKRVLEDKYKQQQVIHEKQAQVANQKVVADKARAEAIQDHKTAIAERQQASKAQISAEALAAIGKQDKKYAEVSKKAAKLAASSMQKNLDAAAATARQKAAATEEKQAEQAETEAEKKLGQVRENEVVKMEATIAGAIQSTEAGVAQVAHKQQQAAMALDVKALHEAGLAVKQVQEEKSDAHRVLQKAEAVQQQSNSIMEIAQQKLDAALMSSSSVSPDKANKLVEAAKHAIAGHT